MNENLDSKRNQGNCDQPGTSPETDTATPLNDTHNRTASGQTINFIQNNNYFFHINSQHDQTAGTQTTPMAGNSSNDKKSQDGDSRRVYRTNKRTKEPPMPVSSLAEILMGEPEQVEKPINLGPEINIYKNRGPLNYSSKKFSSKNETVYYRRPLKTRSPEYIKRTPGSSPGMSPSNLRCRVRQLCSTELSSKREKDRKPHRVNVPTLVAPKFVNSISNARSFLGSEQINHFDLSIKKNPNFLSSPKNWFKGLQATAFFCRKRSQKSERKKLRQEEKFSHTETLKYKPLKTALSPVHCSFDKTHSGVSKLLLSPGLVRGREPNEFFLENSGHKNEIATKISPVEKKTKKNLSGKISRADCEVYKSGSFFDHVFKLKHDLKPIRPKIPVYIPGANRTVVGGSRRVKCSERVKNVCDSGPMQEVLSAMNVNSRFLKKLKPTMGN